MMAKKEAEEKRRETDEKTERREHESRQGGKNWEGEGRVWTGGEEGRRENMSEERSGGEG